MRIQLRIRRALFVTATGVAFVLAAPLALAKATGPAKAAESRQSVKPDAAEASSSESTDSELKSSELKSSELKGAEPVIAEPVIAEQSLGAPSGDLYGDVLERPRKLGLMFDLGSLDGAMLSLVYRPLSWLRTYGGGGTNGAAPGVRLGASVAPFRQRNWALNLDGGHFFEGDVNGIFSAIAGAGYDDSRALEHFDYNFVNLQAGWEAESNGLMFFVRGGVGYVWSQIPPDGLSHLRHVSSLVAADGSVQAFLPSLRIGLIGFF
jgi:hypothetical protein